MNTFPLKSETRQEVLASAIRQEREIKGFKIRKEDLKLSLFIGDIYRCLCRNLRESIKKGTNEFNKLKGLKMNMQQSILFLYTSNEQLEIKIFKEYYYTAKKKKLST